MNIDRAMNIDHVKPIADAVLYEGYILYPYRPTATKNRQRWMFGELFPRDDPRAGGEAASMRAEILLEANEEAEIDIVARFLQSRQRQIGALEAPAAELEEIAHFTPVSTLLVEGRQFVSFDEAIERRIDISSVTLGELVAASRRLRFDFPAAREIEPIRSENGEIVTVIARSSASVEGEIEVGATRLEDGLFRLRATIENVTPVARAEPSRALAQARAFLSTHMIIGARGGRFVSLVEPPDSLRAAAAACENRGLWPALVGERARADMVLASPIILYDYPQVAPESRNAFFDGAEIDELLTLRVQTLTDAEKEEMAAADPRTREILQRCDSMTVEEMGALHGAFRPPPSAAENGLSVGARVRIAPNAGGDVMDMALAGKEAVVASIERDFEGRAHVAVTLVDDPGADLGAAGFPGHRFFFSPQELEPLDGAAP
jgi:hydrogenase maturation protease